MALDVHYPKVGMTTADKIVLNSLLGTSSYKGWVYVPCGKPTSEMWSAPIDDDAEEREWSTIVSQPRVRQALRRMAAKARRQYYAGETEEGGFAVE